MNKICSSLPGMLFSQYFKRHSLRITTLFRFARNQIQSKVMPNPCNPAAAMNPSNQSHSKAGLAMANKTVRTTVCANHPPVENGAVYEKVFVFSNAKQQRKHYKQLDNICINLHNTWLDPDKQNNSRILQIRSDILVYARKWGNLRVPANVRYCLNLFECKFDIPISDFGDDTGVIQGQPYVLGQHSRSDGVWRSTRIPDTIADCSGVSTTYNTKLKYGKSKSYKKIVPFISVGERDDWWKDAEFLNECFKYVDMMENCPPRFLTDELKSRLVTKMKKAVSAVMSFTDKWGYCRLPGNIRENCHIFQYALGEKMFEFGKDYGVYEGTPYENVPPAYFNRFSCLRLSVSK